MVKCEICGKEYQDYVSLGKHVNRTHKVSSKDYYDKYILKGVKPVCEVCGAEVKKFHNINKGYSRACSRKCVYQLTKKTNLERYGVENVFASKDVQQKIKKIHLEKRGVEYPAQSEEVKKKQRDTNLNKYGVEHSFQSAELKEKSRKTCKEKYGTEYANQAEPVKEKMKRTNIERYGSESPLGSDKIKEKIKQTMVEKYGAEYTLLSEELKGKVKNTNIEKYGTEYATQSSGVREKTKQTCLEKYGETTNLKCDKTKEQIKKTNLEKYGVENVLSSIEIQKKIDKIMLDKYGVINATQTHITNFDKWEDKKFNERTFLDGNRYIKRDEMMEFFNITNAITYRHLTALGIEYNCMAGTSSYEAEILEFLQLLDVTNIIQNDRQLICPKELDFYLPDYSLAIEFDGIFWHSEQQGKTKYYHLEKTQACEEKGIQLIHIFEPEWVNKKDIIKSILKSKLYKLEKLCYARQCEIREITVKESSPFLNKHHRQGAGLSSIKLGAFYKDGLVAVMTFSKPSIAKGRKDCSSTTNFEISRFAPKMDYHIPGIASKIFSFFERNYEWEKVLTFADRRYSSKAMYGTIGFELVGETTPCYWYFEKGSTVLKHRFKFRKSELERLLETFDPKLTEYQNMVNGEYDRIWDCGNLKFEYSR
jgi:very-short-patch-repair endonuclease